MGFRNRFALSKSTVATLAVLAVGFLYGWIMNVIALAQLAQAPASNQAVMFVTRCVGVVFPPLGAVLGFL
jgi:hypothetical protein